MSGTRLAAGLLGLLIIQATAPCAPTLTNPGFESGTMSGWTSYGVVWNSVTFYADITAAEGFRFAEFDQENTSPLRTGIYQQAPGATGGVTYRLLVQTNVRWSGPQSVRSSWVRVGVDPWGGTDPNSANVVWSPERSSTLSEQGRWIPMSVAAMARSATVTVFAELQADTGSGTAAGCFDDFDITAGVTRAECLSFDAPLIKEVYRDGLNDLQLMDYDTDGDLDVIIPCGAETKVLLYRNNGLGVMTYTGSIDTGGICERLAFADFDQDGFTDMAVSTEDDEILCYPGDGSWFGTPVATDTPRRPMGMVVGFFDADAYPDIAVACWDDDKLAWYTGDGDLSFTQVSEQGVSNEPHMLVSGLIDGDSIPDLALVSRGGPTLRTYNGWPTSPYFYYMDSTTPGMSACGVQLTDLDEDGDNDIIMGNWGAPWDPLERVHVLEGTGSWQLDDTPTTYYLPETMGPEDVLAGDFNFDGHEDIAVACSIGHSVSVLLGTGDGAIPARYDFPIDPAFLSALVRKGDVDGDGLEDIVVLGKAARHFAVLRNAAPLAASPEGWLKTGWNLVSVPHETEDMAVGVVLDRLVPPNVLDNAVFGYDSGSGYSVYPGGFGGFEVGRGYWLYLSEGGRAVAYGPGTLTTKSVLLSQGWSLVGHPQDNPVLLSDCEVRNGMQTKPFDDAVAAGWVEGVVYGYDGGYFTVRTSGGDDAYLRPWRGYWMLSSVPGLTLYVPAL